MAERRRTSATAPVRPRARRPPPRDEREVAEEDAPQSGRRDEPEPLDEDAPEPVRDRNGDRRAGRRDDPALTARRAASAALRQVVELTGKDAESITEVERTDDGWTIGIEVVEDARIPSSADILATYEARIDEDGELMSYRRVRRYARGRGDC